MATQIEVKATTSGAAEGRTRGRRFTLAMTAAVAAGVALVCAGASPAAAQAAPSAAQSAPIEPMAAATCETILAQTLAINGLNPAFENAEPLSNLDIPSMGFATTDMTQAIDATVGNYMNQFGIPGGAVAITYKNKLIFAKSYGYSDVDNEAFAEPDTRYRAASVSKSLTAMAILTMVHDGVVTLDATPFPFANVGTIVGGTPGNLFTPGTFNQDLSAITVDDLLHHAGGWDRNVAPDLTGYDVLQALAAYQSSVTNTPSGPPNCTALLAYVESQPLQFTPGSETHYSNVGFCALSEVIRERSGGSYIGYLTAHVLKPLAMVDTALGVTPEAQKLDREATYYDTTDSSAASLFPPYPVVTAPYSSIGAIEAQAGAGAIVSTAIDLARFAGAIASGQLPNLPGGRSNPGWPVAYYSDSALLPTYECSNAIPPYPASAMCPTGWSDGWELGHWAFGAGWDQVGPDAVSNPLLSFDNYNFIKDGGFPGTVSSLAATADGYGFGAVFNANDNTAPSPQSQIFWPSCASGTPPLPAAASGNCALQAAYNHTAVAPWNVDFGPQYAAAYSDWMSASAFTTYLRKHRALGLFPSRIEGRLTASSTTNQYRVRLGRQAKGSKPAYLYGQTCPAILSAITSTPANTPLVSLQRFASATGANVYQAVWAAPIAELPAP